MTNAMLADSRVSELRDAFDQAYAIPVASQAAEQMQNFLSVRVAGDPYAINVSEISGLVNDKRIVALPTRFPELLGIAGIRGGLVPVYSLAVLLGYSQEEGQARWLALCGADEPVGLAFRDFEGYLRVPLAQLHAAEQHAVEQKDRTRAQCPSVLRTPDMVRAVVSIPYLLETIKRRCDQNGVSVSLKGAMTCGRLEEK